MTFEHVMDYDATEESFDEAAYLRSNPDIRHAVDSGMFQSGLEHFRMFGHKERRSQRKAMTSLAETRRRKFERLRPHLRSDVACIETTHYFDFLTDDLRQQFNVVETDAVSAHSYDPEIIDLIHRHENNLVLDCGAGKRPVYYENVVNLEIADYDTTDIRAVNEVLPFRENSFDAVISVAVLEHVKDPFQSAQEISRVLKPGGEIFCVVPFLQPLHGYPHHYYNMTHQGLRNLFVEYLEIDELKVLASGHPIWTLKWILQSWSNALSGAIADEFKRLCIGDVLNLDGNELDKDFVETLPETTRLELACAIALTGRKSEHGSPSRRQRLQATTDLVRPTLSE